MGLKGFGPEILTFDYIMMCHNVSIINGNANSVDVDQTASSGAF